MMAPRERGLAGSAQPEQKAKPGHQRDDDEDGDETEGTEEGAQDKIHQHQQQVVGLGGVLNEIQGAALFPLSKIRPAWFKLTRESCSAQTIWA